MTNEEHQTKTDVEVDYSRNSMAPHFFFFSLISLKILLILKVQPLTHPPSHLFIAKKGTWWMMQSYPARALDRRLQVDWARDAREGPMVLMSLRVDFGPMGYV